MNKRFQKKLTKKIMTEVLDTLTALKSSKQLRNDIPLRHAQIHLLDEKGEGVVLSIEYDEDTGEIEKSFSETDGDMEIEFDPEREDIPSEKLDEWESEVLKAKGLLN
jgi:hypothetical protein